MNETTNNINEYTVVPSINSVPLKYKQIFPIVSTETTDNGLPQLISESSYWTTYWFLSITNE